MTPTSTIYQDFTANTSAIVPKDPGRFNMGWILVPHMNYAPCAVEETNSLTVQYHLYQDVEKTVSPQGNQRSYDNIMTSS